MNLHKSQPLKADFYEFYKIREFYFSFAVFFVWILIESQKSENYFFIHYCKTIHCKFTSLKPLN
jgi:hypothetical protein